MDLSERLDRAQPVNVRQQAARDLSDILRPRYDALLARICDADDSREDLLSEIWVELFTAIEQGEYQHARGGNPVGWAMQLALHHVQSHHRHKGKVRRYETAWVDGEWDQLEEMPDDDGVNTYDPSWFDRLDLRRFSEDEVATLAMMREGKTIPQIATASRVSYRTAWRRFHRVLDYCQEQRG